MQSNYFIFKDNNGMAYAAADLRTIESSTLIASITEPHAILKVYTYDHKDFSYKIYSNIVAQDFFAALSKFQN